VGVHRYGMGEESGYEWEREGCVCFECQTGGGEGWEKKGWVVYVS